MTISVPSKSFQYTEYASSPIVMNRSSDWGAKLRASHAVLTFTAGGFTSAANGDIQLIRMPPGKVRILPFLSRLTCPAGTATATLDIGLGKYITQAGVATALNGNQLAAAIPAGVALAQFLALPATGYLDVDSQSGFDIVCSFATANSPAAGDLTLDLVYEMGN